MSVCGEGHTPNNERETKTILNIELFFARLDLMGMRTFGKKALLQSLWWSDLWRKSCQRKKEQKTTNLTELNNIR